MIAWLREFWFGICNGFSWERRGSSPLPAVVVEHLSWDEIRAIFNSTSTWSAEDWLAERRQQEDERVAARERLVYAAVRAWADRITVWTETSRLDVCKNVLLYPGCAATAYQGVRSGWRKFADMTIPTGPDIAAAPQSAT